MAHFRKSFPSRFMQAADLDEGSVEGTIKEVLRPRVFLDT